MYPRPSFDRKGRTGLFGSPPPRSSRVRAHPNLRHSGYHTCLVLTRVRRCSRSGCLPMFWHVGRADRSATMPESVRSRGDGGDDGTERRRAKPGRARSWHRRPHHRHPLIERFPMPKRSTLRPTRRIVGGLEPDARTRSSGIAIPPGSACASMPPGASSTSCSRGNRPEAGGARSGLRPRRRSPAAVSARARAHRSRASFGRRVPAVNANVLGAPLERGAAAGVAILTSFNEPLPRQ